MLILLLAHKFALSFVTLNVTESISSLHPAFPCADGVGTLITIVNTVVEPDVASHTHTLRHKLGSNRISTLDLLAETLNDQSAHINFAYQVSNDRCLAH